MDLRTYLAILWRNLWMVLITVACAIGAVILYTYVTQPIYAATTTLRIATASNGSVVSYSDYMYADRLMNTYTKIAVSSPVMQDLTQKLNLSAPPTIQVKIIPSTELIQITVEHTSPWVAQQAANTLADILITQSKELYTGLGKSPLEVLREQMNQAEGELKQAEADYAALMETSPDATENLDTARTLVQLKQKNFTTLSDQYEQTRLRDAIRENLISVVEPAGLSLKPIKPRTELNLIAGLFLGLVGGVGLVFLFESLDTRLYTSKDIEKAADFYPFGKIPHNQKSGFLGIKTRRSRVMNTHYIESIRRIITKLLTQKTSVLNGRPLKSYLITSSIPKEGKSTFVAHLATELAQMGHPVVVVDCDMRLPTQHKIHGLPNAIGLSTLLSLESGLDESLQQGKDQNLTILTSGPAPENPTELLASKQMKALLDELTCRYEIVLMDTPAILAVADAVALMPLAEGVLLLARRTYIREEQIRETCHQLVDSRARTIGLIINDAEKNSTTYYYRYQQN